MENNMDIDIPSFINQSYETDELSQVVLNNVPGNSEIEEINHLNELEEVCKNWKPQEWERVIVNAKSELIINELLRRITIQEDFIRNNKSNVNRLSELRGI